MPEITCPVCAEADRLRGERAGGSIMITCSSCGATWERDLAARCRTCGSHRVVYAPKPLWEKGRGDQRTPAGRIDAHHCAECGDDDALSGSDR